MARTRKAPRHLRILLLTAAALWLSGLNAGAFAMEQSGSPPDWPDLKTVGAVSGRPATSQDVDQGDAAFLINGEEVSEGTPLEILLPQYAWHIDQETKARTPVVVIQAESAQGHEMAGYLIVTTGGFGVSLLSELELLGSEVPQ